MSDLLLSRTFDPADLAQLVEELVLVDNFSPNGTPPHRRWEQALALHAVRRWEQAQPPTFQGTAWGCDISREDSRFALLLRVWADCETTGLPVALPWARCALRVADVVTCLSIIERVEDLDQCLYHLSCLVRPGGLLVLTMPYWNRCGPDTAMDCDQRLRIFCPRTYQQLRAITTALHLTTFGGVDPTYHGAQIADYSLASLVVEKRR